jgi:hypothetical protein
MSKATDLLEYMGEGKALTSQSMKAGLKIVNKQNPEWGEWKVLGPAKGVKGVWEIRGERQGERTLGESEFKFWEIV